MVYTYPAVMTPIEDGSGYYARVPDLPGCATSGRDLNDALYQITDAMSGWLCVAEDERLPIAKPTDVRDVPHGEDEIVTLVQADVALYRAMTDTRAVRKTVSIPQWMASAAERMGLSLSQLLQDSLRERIGSKG